MNRVPLEPEAGPELCQNEAMILGGLAALSSGLVGEQKSWLSPLLRIVAPFIPGIAITWAT